jgi:FkbM family methyltransferase
MPLTSGHFWQEWDTAVSITGHDLEVKETYSALIDSTEKPNLFIDIGANYGTHSLLFNMQNFMTMTFEPNSSCHDYYSRVCSLNGVTANIEPIALGETAGYMELSYPERDTWLGSTDTAVVEELASSHQLVTEKVEQKRLDDYFSQIEGHKVLIKIDTEGNELAVLKGSLKILQAIKPKIIFESLAGSDRNILFTFLASQNYKIYQLPWNPKVKTEPLNPNQFVENSLNNFIAVPMSTLSV